MSFTPVETIALIFAIAVILKIAIISFSSRGWSSVVKSLYKNSALLVIAELILSGIVFYYLIQELNVIQIVACLVLGALLTGMTFAVYGKEFLPFAEKVIKGNLLKKSWLPILLWLAIAIWVLTELF